MTLPERFEAKDLAELTDDLSLRGRPIPDDVINALKASGWVTETFACLPEAPPDAQSGQLHALVPFTGIVIKHRQGAWDLLKAFAYACWSVDAYTRGETDEAQSAVLETIQALGDLKEHVEKLTIDRGEYCIYLSLLRSRSYVERMKGSPAQWVNFVSKHETYGHSCTQSSCDFHDGKACNITVDQRFTVIEQMEQRKFITRKDQSIWLVV